MKSLVITIAVIAVVIGYVKSDNDPDNEVITQGYKYDKDQNHVSLSVQLFDLLMGRYNFRGYGKSGGVVYTRWGRTTCESKVGSTVLYTGGVGGTHYGHTGGGANYLCLPKNPQYFSSGIASSYSIIYGAEYQNVLFPNLHDYDVPCAVCYVPTRSTKLMIPADIKCPESWTEEYKGYLMSSHFSHRHTSTFECVDANAEGIAGSKGNVDGTLFYHVASTCHYGVKCPPFINKRAISCVVCTK